MSGSERSNDPLFWRGRFERAAMSGVLEEARLDNKGVTNMLWTILLVVLVLWLLGFIGGIGGNLIHVLLVVGLIVLVVNLLRGRSSI
jgi:hypothetical protein